MWLYVDSLQGCCVAYVDDMEVRDVGTLKEDQRRRVNSPRLRYIPSFFPSSALSHFRIESSVE